MQEGVRRRRNGRGLMFLKCWRMLAVAAAVLALSGIVAGCGAVGVQYLTYFDTVTSITIYAEDEEQFAKWEQLVHSELERYHQLYDIYHSYEGVNNIKVINDHAGISPVEVSEDILDLREWEVCFLSGMITGKWLWESQNFLWCLLWTSWNQRQST